MRIGIDLMGSDTLPHNIFQAVYKAAYQMPSSCTFVVFASQNVAYQVHDIIQKEKQDSAKIEVSVVSDFILMDEEPVHAVKLKKEASLIVGLKLLKKKFLNAFISSGNTGALIAGASLILPHLPGIRRPALLAELPTLGGYFSVVDVGGNVSCKAHQLVQFARMGAAFQRCARAVEMPRVGLLNIGTESKKGTREHRLAYEYLQEHSGHFFNFIGNVEGREIFHNKVDVLVTDGFTGNVLLKAVEGVSSFILETIRNKQEGYVSDDLTVLEKRFNHNEYPGAIVCGVDGLVIKCHGNASSTALIQSIKGAASMVSKGLIPQIKNLLEI